MLKKVNYMLYNIFWFETAIFVPNNPIITHIIIGRKCSKGWIPQKKTRNPAFAI